MPGQARWCLPLAVPDAEISPRSSRFLEYTKSERFACLVTHKGHSCQEIFMIGWQRKIHNVTNNPENVADRRQD